MNIDGEVPVSGGGLDVDSLWTELSGSADGRVIAGSHIPLATASSNGGIRTGYSGTGKNYPVELDSSGRAYVNVPWVNTTYSLSSFGITATAAEINKLDGIGTLLHSGNYTSVLNSVYMRIGTSGFSVAYRRYLNINSTAYSFFGTTGADAATLYAPTTAGTSGYVLQSTGGTPAWAAQNTLVVKGIYERSLGVAAGDTMADLKSSLTTQMGSNLNKPGSMGFVTAASVSNIMSNWANDNYELVAGSRTNFLRLDGYGSSTYGVFLVSGYLGSFYRLMGTDSKWSGPYTILDTGNYTSHLDSRYVNISGDTMTGALTLGDSSRLNLVVGGTTRTAVYDDGDYTIFGDPDYKACVRGSRIIFQNAVGSSGLVMEGDTFTFKGNSIWHAGNDGSGSGLDADLLDGTHKSRLLTALTSNATTNLSLTVGGTVKTVTDLYATYLEGQTLAETRRGMSFLTSSFSAAGWYRVFTSTNPNTVYTNEVLLRIGRTYTSPQNEHYSFSICVGYDGDISITQLSGVMGGHIITKIRVVWDNSKIFYIDVYVRGASNGYDNMYGVTGQGDGTFSAFTSGAAIPDGYTAYEFATVDGCKSDRGFSGALSGNATSATKLQTSRTLWGRPFDGTGNVSGDMTGVGSITASGQGSFDTLKISNTSGAAHLAFSRANYNYITAPSSGYISFNTNGIGEGSDASDLTIYAHQLFPGTTNTVTLGISSRRWSNVYSVLGNFSGRITAAGLTSSASIVANAGLSTTALSASGAATLSSTLSVSGLIKALDGVQIGSTKDIGWYNYNSRIAAGINTTRGVNAGSLLVSNAWADYTKVPENGIYSKGEIVCSSDIYPDVTASVNLGSATKRWLGVYARNGSFSGSVSVSSLNVVTEATVKTLVPDKLHLPSGLGNEVFDIYVDTEVSIDGETPVSVSFQPQWYGWINADGTAAKQGGSVTLTAVRTAAGTLRLNGIAADSTVIAVPAAFSTGSTGSPRTTVSVLKSGSAHYVQTYNNAGTRANLAFYLLVI